TGLDASCPAPIGFRPDVVRRTDDAVITSITGCRPAVRRSDAEQVDHEDQRLAGLDRRRRALVAVGQVRGDGQLAAAADLHALHALVPALDDPAGAQREPEGSAAVPAGVELLARAEGDTDVVHGDRVTRLGHLAVTLPDVLDLEVRRGLAAREVDLGLVDAH